MKFAKGELKICRDIEKNTDVKKIGKNARENNEKYSPKNSGGKITVCNYCLWVIYELPYLLLSSLLPHLRHHFLNLTFFRFFPSPADSWWICQLWHVFYWLTRMFLDPWSLTLILTRIPSWYIVSFIAQCWFLCKSNCAKNAGSQFMWQFHPPKIKLAPRLHNAHNLPSLKIISQLYLQCNTIIQLSYMNNSYFLLKGNNWAKSCNTHQYI